MQQESLPAPMGEWCYMTRASEDTGGLIFVRRDAAGYEQTVLDLSDPQHAHTALGQVLHGSASFRTHIMAWPSYAALTAGGPLSAPACCMYRIGSIKYLHHKGRARESECLQVSADCR